MSGSVDLGGRRIIKKIFFKQKTAYEIVTGDWSSDVCSSDLEEFQMLDDGQTNVESDEYGDDEDDWQFYNDPVTEIGRASCRERV